MTPAFLHALEPAWVLTVLNRWPTVSATWQFTLANTWADLQQATKMWIQLNRKWEIVSGVGLEVVPLQFDEPF